MSTTTLPVGRAAAVVGPSVLTGLRRRLMVAGGVLVAAASLANGARDLYIAVNNEVPRTEEERRSLELFKKYAQRKPLQVVHLPVKSPQGTAAASLYVFEEGDIQVEYGGKVRWMSIVESSPRAQGGLPSLIPTAHAGPVIVRSPVTRPVLTQTNTIKGGTLTQKRVFGDGAAEESRIDMRTGTILGTRTWGKPRFDLPLPSAGGNGAGGGSGSDNRTLPGESPCPLWSIEPQRVNCPKSLQVLTVEGVAR